MPGLLSHTWGVRCGCGEFEVVIFYPPTFMIWRPILSTNCSIIPFGESSWSNTWQVEHKRYQWWCLKTFTSLKSRPRLERSIVRSNVSDFCQFWTEDPNTWKIFGLERFLQLAHLVVALPILGSRVPNLTERMIHIFASNKICIRFYHWLFIRYL